MIPILVGLALVALGVLRFQRQHVPSEAVRLPGTVADVQETQSRKNRRLTLRRPVVTVDHPVTGRREQVTPDEYGRETFRVGDAVDVAYLRGDDRFVLVSDRPLRNLLLLPVAGLAVIGLQVADWLS